MGSLTLPPYGLVYVDTVTVIYSVEENPVYWLPTRPLWVAAKAGRIDIFTSELTLMEVLVGPEKTGNPEVAGAYEEFLSEGSRLIPITQSILRSAARLRAQANLRTPDAVHAATALAEGCELFVTNGAGFKRVPGLKVTLLSDAVSS